jgi:four helix bundle protein
MTNYDLEERTFCFAKDSRAFIKGLPQSISNLEDGRQLIRSSGSVGANYIEANEAVSKKDFNLRIKICRKEAKESRYWLKLLASQNTQQQKECAKLIQEATELMNIFGAILKKCS